MILTASGERVRGRFVVVVGDAVGGDRAAPAQELVRRAARRRSPSHLRHIHVPKSAAARMTVTSISTIASMVVAATILDQLLEA